jgi:hypothetical protein
VSPAPLGGDDATVEERFVEVTTGGRMLFDNEDGAARHLAPFVVAGACTGDAIALLVHRVALFALALGSLLATLVSVGVIPGPFLAFALMWGAGGAVALTMSRRRQREHGRYLIDFETGELFHLAHGDSPARRRWRRFELKQDARWTRSPPGASDSERAARPWGEREGPEARTWLIVQVSATGPRVRIGRGTEAELSKIFMLLRQYGVRGG